MRHQGFAFEQKRLGLVAAAAGVEGIPLSSDGHAGDTVGVNVLVVLIEKAAADGNLRGELAQDLVGLGTEGPRLGGSRGDFWSARAGHPCQVVEIAQIAAWRQVHQTHRIAQAPPQGEVVGGGEHRHAVSRLQRPLLGVGQRDLRASRSLRRPCPCRSESPRRGVPRQACRTAYVDVRDALGPQHGNVISATFIFTSSFTGSASAWCGSALGVRGIEVAGNPAEGVDRLARYGLKSVTVAAKEREAVRRQARRVEGERRLVAEGEGITRRSSEGKRSARAAAEASSAAETFKSPASTALIACQCDPPGVLLRYVAVCPERCSGKFGFAGQGKAKTPAGLEATESAGAWGKQGQPRSMRPFVGAIVRPLRLASAPAAGMDVGQADTTTRPSRETARRHIFTILHLKAGLRPERDGSPL